MEKQLEEEVVPVGNTVREPVVTYQQAVEDFEKGILHLIDYSGVKKFKSIRRAIRRGHVSIFGTVYPKRPFKNTKSKKGTLNYIKKRLYEQYTHKNRKVS